MTGDRVASDDRGYLYGDALFETVLVDTEGRVRWLSHHIERLRSSASGLGFVPARIEEAIQALYQIANSGNCGAWRVTLSRDGSGVAYGGVGSVTIRHRPYHKKVRRPSLGLAHGFFHRTDSLARYKTTSRMRFVEAQRRVQRDGFDEALLISPDGFVGESPTANVIVVKNGNAFTPPLEGILPGVTRQGLIRLARRHHMPIEVRPLKVDDAMEADEIVLVSSVVGALPAASIGQRELSQKWAHMANQWLSHEAFEI